MALTLRKTEILIVWEAVALTSDPVEYISWTAQSRGSVLTFTGWPPSRY